MDTNMHFYLFSLRRLRGTNLCCCKILESLDVQKPDGTPLQKMNAIGLNARRTNKIRFGDRQAPPC